MLLLVLASANVANLLLARGIRRAKEIAVRAALGAERARQVRQMLVESLVFAALGTVVGLAVAHPLSALLVGLVPNTLSDQLGLTRDHGGLRAALFAAADHGVVGVLAGLVPALKLAGRRRQRHLAPAHARCFEQPPSDARAGRRRGGAGRRCCW